MYFVCGVTTDGRHAAPRHKVIPAQEPHPIEKPKDHSDVVSEQTLAAIELPPMIISQNIGGYLLTFSSRSQMATAGSFGDDFIDPSTTQSVGLANPISACQASSAVRSKINMSSWGALYDKDAPTSPVQGLDQAGRF
jgi:hypothetical protein